MSLEEALLDIKDNVENIEVTLEDNSNLAIKEEPRIITIEYKALPNDIKERVRTFINLISYKDEITKQEKINKAVALEVFTMLPLENKTEEAKLTTNPSKQNKEQVIRLIDLYLENNDVSEELKDSLLSLEESLNEVKRKEDDINYYLESVDKELITPLKALHKVAPIVVFNKENHNLLLTPIKELIQKALTWSYQYEVFDEGNRLNKLLEELLEDRTLTKYLDLKNLDKDSITLEMLANSFYEDFNSRHTTLKEIRDYEELIDKVKSNKSTLEEKELIIDAYDDIVRKLNLMKFYSSLVEYKDNFLVKITKLLNFIAEAV